MSLTRPLTSSPSDHTREREARLRRTRAVIVARSGSRCEGGCGKRATDGAHGFRRGNRLHAILSDHPALVLFLCRECHQRLDLGTTPADCAWRADLEWRMVERALDAFRLVPVLRTPVYVDHDDGPIDVLRRIERALGNDVRNLAW